MPDGVTRDLQMQVRQGTFAPSSMDNQKRTIQVVWTTGARVRRYDYWRDRAYEEELVVSDDAVDLARLNAGAPLLDTHGMYRLAGVIGVVERAWIEGGEGHAIVRFSSREDLAPLVRDVEDGIIRNISVGYQIRKVEVVEEEGRLPLYRAVDWTPMEISLVPIGADAGAGTRSAPPSTNPCVYVTRAAAHSKENSMTEKTPAGGGSPAAEQINPAVETEQRSAPAAPPAAPAAVPGGSPADIAAAAVAAERTRSAEIRKIGTMARMEPAAIEAMVSEGLTVEAARTRAFDALAAEADKTPTRSHVTVTADAGDTFRRIAANALLNRYDSTVPLEDGARQFRGMSLMEIGAEALTRQNVSLRGLGRAERAALMLDARAGGLHTTADFPTILGNVMQTALRRSYEAAPQTFKPFTRRATLPDFKTQTLAQLGDAPALLPVDEHGEFRSGTIGEGKEQWRLYTYGRKFGVTRQVLINDNLDAFTRIPAMFGLAAANLESNVVWSVITDNAAMGDGNALFHNSHGNLAAAATAPNEGSLEAASRAMRLQTSLGGNYINITPRFLIVPVALEVTAKKLMAQVTPHTTGDVNPFAGSYTIISEPRLDANSTTSWYMAADPAQVDTIVYGFLQGQEGLYTETRMGFDVDGVEVKARLDFGAKSVDWRGLYKNAG